MTAYVQRQLFSVRTSHMSKIDVAIAVRYMYIYVDFCFNVESFSISNVTTEIA